MLPPLDDEVLLATPDFMAGLLYNMVAQSTWSSGMPWSGTQFHQTCGLSQALFIKRRIMICAGECNFVSEIQCLSIKVKGRTTYSVS